MKTQLVELRESGGGMKSKLNIWQILRWYATMHPKNKLRDS